MAHFLHKKSIIKKTIQVGGSTLISRMLGVVRELLMVKFLGAGAASDAFITAFKIPNSLRKIFAEGALSAAFVPSFITILRKEESYAHSLMTWAFLVFEGALLVLCALIMYFASLVITLVAPGFSSEQIALTIPLLRILMPFIFFISSSALLAAALQAMGRFFVPAFGPILLNFVFIIGLLICWLFKLRVDTFCFFVLVGGLLLFVHHLIAYWQLHFSFGPLTVRSWEVFKEILPKFFLCLLSMSVMEISLFIDTAFASYLPEGSISLIYYANRFMGIPLGVFAVALSTILLPHFSRISVYAPKRLNFYLLESAKLVFWVTVPCTVAMIFFSHDIFATLFVSKSFSSQQAIEAGHILSVFSAGLFFFSFNKILLNIFYAFHATAIPSLVSVIGTVANIVLNFILMQFMQALGLALATTISGVVQTVLLLYFLYKKLGFHGYGNYFAGFACHYVGQLIIASGIFYVVYRILYKLIAAVAPAEIAYFFLHNMGFWFWIAPLSALVWLFLYVSRKWFGVSLYFLD